MNTHLTNFGPRLRRMIESRGGSFDEAADKLGIARGTLYNWFELSVPPKRRSARDKLRQYLGNRDAEFLHPDLISDTEGDDEEDSLAEDQAPYGTPAQIRREITQRHADLLDAAGDDIARLGWILIQQRTHLQPPADWIENKKPAVRIVRAPAHQQNPIQPGSGRASGGASAA